MVPYANVKKKDSMNMEINKALRFVMTVRYSYTQWELKQEYIRVDIFD